MTLGKLLTIHATLASDTDVEAFSRALELLAEDPEEKAFTQTYMAFALHFNCGRPRRLCNWSIRLCPSTASLATLGIGFCLVLRGLASYAVDGNADESLALLEEALAIYRRLNSPHSLARFLSHQASLELTLGRLEEARNHATEGLEMAGRVGDRPCICKLLLVLGEVQEGLGQDSESWRSHQRVLELTREMRLVPIQIRILARMGRLLAEDRREGRGGESPVFPGGPSVDDGGGPSPNRSGPGADGVERGGLRSGPAARPQSFNLGEVVERFLAAGSADSPQASLNAIELG